MPFGSILGPIIGSAVGGIFQGGAAEQAAGQQANAANNATNAQLQMFNTQNQQQLPYRQAGQNALSQIMAGFSNTGPKTLDQFKSDQLAQTNQNLINKFGAGTKTLDPNDPNQQTIYGGMSEADQIADVYKQAQTDFDQQQSGAQNGAVPGGYFAHQFNAQDLNENLAPNYKFQLDQGLGAVSNAANLNSGLSGNFFKGINDYAQNYAGNAYQQAYNNYTANQSNIFNRLSTVANLGSAANQQSAGLAGSIAPGVSSSIQGAGAAQAAGTIGSANALAGGANNALGWYSLGNILNSGGSQTGQGIG